jgi:hypothetical protein
LHLRQLLLRSYPSGIVGAGLLILRFSISLTLLSGGVSIPIIAAAALIAVGFLNPLSALLAAFLEAFSANPSPASAAICVSLSLIGPGAFSLDARRFGRREIIIPLPQSGYSNNIRSGDSE